MKIQIFCFSLMLITAGLIYAAVPKEMPKEPSKQEEPKTSPQDFKRLEDLPDFELSNIASKLPYADLGRFEGVSSRFQKIAQAEFKNRLGDAGYLWAKGEIIPNQFHAHEVVVNSVFVSNNGSIVSVGSTDRHISVWKWDGTVYKKIRQMTDDFNYNYYFIFQAEFSPAENRLVLRHAHNIINVWDVQAGKKINQFNIGVSYFVALSPNGTTIASRSEAENIEFWDAVKGVKTKQITAAMTGYRDEIRYLAFSTDGKKLASSSQSEDEPVLIWNVETLALENKFKFNKEYADLLFLPDNKLIAYQHETEPPPTYLIWDVETSELIGNLEVNVRGVKQLRHLAFSHDGALVAEGVTGNILPVWSIRTKKIVQTLHTKNQILSLAFSPDDKMLVAGCENGDIVTWKAQPKKKEAKSTK